MRLVKISLITIVAFPAILLSLFIVGIDPTVLFYHAKVATNQGSLFSETYECGKYYWKVQEREEVVKGGYGGNGFYSTHTAKERTLILGDKGGAIAELKPNEIKYATYTDNFPAGEAFIHAYIFGASAFTRQQPNIPELRRQLFIPSSKVSETDFKKVAECLNQNLSRIEDQLNETDSVKYPFGWLILVDSSVKRDDWSGYPAYECSDGGRMVTLDRGIQYISAENKKQKASIFGPVARDFDFVGVIGLDGNVYSKSQDEPNSKINLPNIQCLDSNGRSLQTALSSIPGRMTVLNRL